MRVKNGFFKGVLTVSTGAFLAKLIGALYRIPLTNIIGAQGIGLYQMVFPLYCILLTLSSTGIPNSLAKIISEGKSDKQVLSTAIKLFIPLGVLGSLIMLIFGYPLAYLQGNVRAGLGYITLAPSVLLTSVLSCFRGYFQGKSNMKPTAVSQVVEQVVKLGVGLSLGFVFRKNPTLSAGFCALAVTFSELVACLYVYYLYKKDKGQTQGERVGKKAIIKVVVPITFSAILIPISRVADSFMILNILKKYLLNATEVYGIYTGGVESVIGVPVSLCYGFAVASIPLISSIKDKLLAREKGKKIFFYTAFLGAVFSVLVFLFAEVIVKILYFNLSLQNKNLMANLIRASCLCVVGLSLVQTTSAILVSVGKTYIPCVNLLVAVVVKIILSLVMLPIPSINIYATAISDTACYFIAFLLNSWYIFKPKLQ